MAESNFVDYVKIYCRSGKGGRIKGNCCIKVAADFLQLVPDKGLMQYDSIGLILTGKFLHLEIG